MIDYATTTRILENAIMALLSSVSHFFSRVGGGYENWSRLAKAQIGLLVAKMPYSIRCKARIPRSDYDVFTRKDIAQMFEQCEDVLRPQGQEH